MYFIQVQEAHFPVTSFDEKRAKPHVIRAAKPETRSRDFFKSWRFIFYSDKVAAKK